MVKRAFAFIMFVLAFALSVNGADRKFTLCIDAGHGGKDTGAPGTYSKEKDINLKTALAFGRYVERNCPDVRVIYTRKTDVFVPLYERAEIANRNKADLFISIHTNALAGGHIARGFETYTLGDGRSHATKTNLEVAKRENSVILLEKDYKQHYVGFDPNSPESNIMFEFVQDKNLAKSIEMAKMLQKNVCRMANRPDKGVHQQNLAVLRLTSMPACLLELGYITTPDEEQMLNDKGRMDLVARGIYNAFTEYKNKYDTGFAVPYKTESEPIPAQSAVQNDNSDKPEQSADDDNDDSSDRQETPASPSAQPEKDSKETLPAKKTGSDTSSRQTSRTAATPPSDSRKRSDASTTAARQNAGNSLSTASRPVFKIQILVSSRILKPGDEAFKGLEGCSFYEEGGKRKYTYGSSTDYNEIYRLRRQIAEQFPGAFIIAFKDGQKMDVNQGIREFKLNRNSNK